MIYIFIKFLTELIFVVKLAPSPVFFLLQKEPHRHWLEQVKEMVSLSVWSVEKYVHRLCVDMVS